MRIALLALIIANAAVYFIGVYGDGEAAINDWDRASAPRADGGIRLVSEVDRVGGGEASSSARSAVSESPVDACWLLGPFAGGRERFELPAGLSARWMYDDVEVDVDYWVLLGPYAEKAEALNMVRKLKRSNVDSYLIPKGELKNSISLGVFSEQSRAERHAKAMRSKGYDALLRRISETERQSWLVLEPEGGAATSAARAFMAAQITNNAVLVKKSCESIASLKDFD